MPLTLPGTAHSHKCPVERVWAYERQDEPTRRRRCIIQTAFSLEKLMYYAPFWCDLPAYFGVLWYITKQVLTTTLIEFCNSFAIHGGPMTHPHHSQYHSHQSWLMPQMTISGYHYSYLSIPIWFCLALSFVLLYRTLFVRYWLLVMGTSWKCHRTNWHYYKEKCHYDNSYHVHSGTFLKVSKPVSDWVCWCFAEMSSSTQTSDCRWDVPV